MNGWRVSVYDGPARLIGLEGEVTGYSHEGCFVWVVLDGDEEPDAQRGTAPANVEPPPRPNDAREAALIRDRDRVYTDNAVLLEALKRITCREVADPSNCAYEALSAVLQPRAPRPSVVCCECRRPPDTTGCQADADGERYHDDNVFEGTAEYEALRASVNRCGSCSQHETVDRLKAENHRLRATASAETGGLDA